MSHKIAIIGAGINGLMTALFCAREGAQVDIYDAGDIPNQHNLSWDHGRLWRLVHEGCPSLQSLASASYPYWRNLIAQDQAAFGCLTNSLRVLEETACRHLEKIYRSQGLGYEITEPGLSTQKGLLRLSDTGLSHFIASDAMLLNARNICLYISQLLSECRKVRRFPFSRIDMASVQNGNMIMAGRERRSYSQIIFTTGTPGLVPQYSQGRSPAIRHQVHMNVFLNDPQSSQLTPVLSMGDSNLSWCVPSPDRRVLKLSASKFSFPDQPDTSQLDECREYLLARLNLHYESVDVITSTYFELPSTERAWMPYWYQTPETGNIVIDSCDASMFKIAPALSGEICRFVIHGVKE